LDLDLQKLAEEKLDEAVKNFGYKGALGGAAVVMDVYDGSIIVMASSPRYNYTDFDDKDKYKILTGDVHRPLENRAINNYYPIPPGSTFKIMVSLYALELGIVDENSDYYCRGYMHEPGKFRCTHVHYNTRIVKAIEGSCNIYFYHVGETLGPKRLEHCAKLFGFGTKSGLNIGTEYAGYIPTPESKKRYGEPWYKGDSRFFGIGQQIKANPLQVARAMAMVANKGSLLRPKLVDRLMPAGAKSLSSDVFDEKTLVSTREQRRHSRPSIIHHWPIQQKYWHLVREGMRKVTDGSYGTAKNVRSLLGDIKIASKTGTSEVGKDKEDHAWFAGFFPLDSPRYSFAVVVEHGGYGGSAAGPVAAEIIRATVEKYGL
jgi:penicillin-binding protein 2